MATLVWLEGLRLRDLGFVLSGAVAFNLPFLHQACCAYLANACRPSLS